MADRQDAATYHLTQKGRSSSYLKTPAGNPPFLNQWPPGSVSDDDKTRDQYKNLALQPTDDTDYP